MRFSRMYRWLAILIGLVLLASGIVWTVADRWKAGPDGEFWQRWIATALMVHGGAAMAALLLLGALGEIHIRRAWRANRNRATGILMVLVNGLLVVSALALYYSGSETLRPWISAIHITGGLALPLLIALHIVVGRRSR